MKSKLALFSLLLLAVPFMGGCKGWLRGGNNKLVVTYKPDRNASPITKELEVKQSDMAVSELTTTANGQAARIVMYSIVLTNYEVDAKEFHKELPSKDNQIKVEIEVVGADGSSKTTPLKPGTYNASQPSDGVNRFNKAMTIRVLIYENGQVMEQSLSTVNPRKGHVTINSVDDDTVTGEIDMSDDFRSVKGEFRAEIIKR